MTAQMSPLQIRTQTPRIHFPTDELHIHPWSPACICYRTYTRVFPAYMLLQQAIHSISRHQCTHARLERQIDRYLAAYMKRARVFQTSEKSVRVKTLFVVFFDAERCTRTCCAPLVISPLSMRLMVVDELHACA
jgi:hypothetical protein